MRVIILSQMTRAIRILTTIGGVLLSCANSVCVTAGYLPLCGRVKKSSTNLASKLLKKKKEVSIHATDLFTPPLH